MRLEARLRGEAAQPSTGSPAMSQPIPADVAAERGTSRLRQRVEPGLGKSGLGKSGPGRSVPGNNVLGLRKTT